MILRFLLAGLLIVGTLTASAAPPRPQYLFLNRAPGQGFDQNNPASISDSLFTEPLERIGTPGTNIRRLGLSFFFSYLNGPLDKIEATLRRVLALAESHGTPVLIVLDGEDWWGGRPDLWNWWDPSQPGFDVRNRENVEWTGPSAEDAVKVCWRNWGRQIRVLPQPNLASPAFRGAGEPALVRLTGTIKRWADSLPEDRRYLFPGVNIGSEASIGINFYHYPDGNALYDAHPTDDSLDPRSGMDMKKDFAGGLVPMGYAALDSKGWQHAGAVTLRDQERITADYLGFLAHVCRAAGLRRDQIFTHAGGQYAPWDLHYSHAVAINRDSLPGWSLYGTAPAAAGDLGASLDRAHLTAWAAAEWLPFATTAVQWRDAIDTTLGFKHCRFLSVYNWEGIRDHPEALAGIREALGSSDAHPNKAVSAPGTEGAVKEIRDRVLVHRETDFWTPALR